MSETLTLPSKTGTGFIFLWLLIAWLGFALLPSRARIMVLTGTPHQMKFFAAYGWHGLNVSWLWYLLLVSTVFPLTDTRFLRPARDANYTDIAGSRSDGSGGGSQRRGWEGKGLGYSAIVLFILLGMIMTLASNRPEWLAVTSLLLAH